MGLHHPIVRDLVDVDLELRGWSMTHPSVRFLVVVRNTLSPWMDRAPITLSLAIGVETINRSGRMFPGTLAGWLSKDEASPLSGLHHG